MSRGYAPPMRRLLASGVCLTTAMLGFACGGDDDGGAAGETVSAQDYANGLCDVFVDFADRAEKSIKEGGLQEATTGNMDSVEDLPELLDGLEKMFSDLEKLFGELDQELVDLGVPDVDKGPAFAQKLVDMAEKGRAEMGKASKAIEETDPDSLSDLSALRPVFDDFQKVLVEASVDPAKEAPKEVADAYKNSESCQALRGEDGEEG